MDSSSATRPPARIEALLTCFNRRDETVACIERLHDQRLSEQDSLHVTLVDDGSSDGTASAVAAIDADATIVTGSGDLFWCRGMARAYASLLDSGRAFTHVLMVNDDTVLAPTAVSDLLDLLGPGADDDAIAIGLVADPGSGELVYGGFRRVARLNPLGIALRPLGDDSRLVAMNGNCVLIPRKVLTTVGFVDGVFHHRFGDLDLGMRAVRSGIVLRATAGPVAWCALNPHGDATAHARSVSFRGWVDHLRSPKGLRPADWLEYSRRHGGPLWPIFWARAYVKATLYWPYSRVHRLLPRRRSIGAAA